jgi:hypothetical protein
VINRPQLGQIHGNAVYSKGATMPVACLNHSTGACTTVCPLQEWVAQGHDRGTTLAGLPPDGDVVAAARRLLGMPA